MNSILRKILGPGLSLILFAVAAWLLHHELTAYHFRDILHAFDAIAGAYLWAAAGLTALSYAVMTGYDVLAVRYRLYSAWGLSTLQITQVVAFCTLTLWLGFFTLGGAVFLIEPPTIPAAIHLPLASLRPIGMVMLAVVLAYGIATAAKKTAIKIRQWEIHLPSAGLFVSQLIIAALDWMLASLVLFVLLAPGTAMSYPGLLAVYLLAQLAGLVSQVPGGLACSKR